MLLENFGYKMNIIKNKKLWIIVSILLITCIFFVTTSFFEKKNIYNIFKLTVKDCQLDKKECFINIDEFHLKINVSKNIEYLKYFDITVSTKVKKDFIIKATHIVFSMKDMDMGINKFTLKTNSYNKKEQEWHGKAILPMCITGETKWFTELILQGENRKYFIKFPLTVK